MRRRYDYVLRKVRAARKDHFCNGNCRIKRIHTGKPYFVVTQHNYGRFYNTTKYHTHCLPERFTR